MSASKRNVLLVTALATLLVAPVAHAQDETVVLRPSNLIANGWSYAVETQGATPPVGMLVAGPGVPPLGAGSASFVLNEGADGLVLGTGSGDLIGLRLDALTELSYCTYVGANTGVQAVSLQLNFDHDTTDGDTSWNGRLVFEPYQNGVVQLGQWQCWDTLAGEWWSSWNSPENVFPQSNPESLASILASFPDAGFNSSFGGLLMKAGSGWSTFDGNADALTIAFGGASTTYDFESEPIDKNDCKKGGWADFGFKNQGQCIQYVNTGK